MANLLFWLAQKREKERDEENRRLMKVESKLGSKKIVNSFVVTQAHMAHARKRVRYFGLHDMIPTCTRD